MKATERKRLQAVEFLEAVFDGQVELDHVDGELRVAGHQLVRELLIERLRHGIAIGEAPLFEMLFEKAGLGDSGSELTRVVTDKLLPMRSRSAAFSILLGSGFSPDGIRSELRDVTPRDLLSARLRDAALATLLDASHSAAVAQILAAVPGEERIFLLEQLEAIRHDVVIPAPLLYRHCAGAFSAAEDAIVFDALVKDAHPDGIALLERVDARAGDAETHARVESAIARLRDRLAKNDRPVPAGRAIILPAFQGQTAVQLELSNRDGSTTRVAIVAIRGQIEHTIVDIDEPGHPAERAPDDLVAATDLPTAAAYLASLALAESLTLSSAAVLLRAIPPGTVPPAAAAASAPASELRDLFARDAYEGWGVLAEEFEPAGVAPPEGWNATDAWIDESAHAVANDDLARRMAFEARHMATFHALRGETREASLLARAAEDASGSFERSALLRESLRGSVTHARAAIEAGDAEGDDRYEEEEHDEFADFAGMMEPLVERITAQIDDGTPAATRAAFEKLTAMGIGEDESVRILALLLLSETRDSEAKERAFDAARWERRLALLPNVDAAMEFQE